MASPGSLTRKVLFWLVPSVLLLPAVAAAASPDAGPTVFGVPLDFVLFGLTLLGVALFHHKTMQVAVTGLVVISALQDRLLAASTPGRAWAASSAISITNG